MIRQEIKPGDLYETLDGNIVKIDCILENETLISGNLYLHRKDFKEDIPVGGILRIKSKEYKVINSINNCEGCCFANYPCRDEIFGLNMQCTNKIFLEIKKED